MESYSILPEGSLLKQGEYRIIRVIASGGFGNTYEVEHMRLGKRMAMKEFYMRGINQREGTSVTVSVNDNLPIFEQMRQKFFKEAKRLAGLEEQHIVEVSDFFEENQTAYYVMKLINGQSLSATMKKQGHPFQEEQVRKFLDQILPALDYVHQKGLYHLDLKPGNIMCSQNGHCYLIDFGASKQMTQSESLTLSTSTGLCYTPGYAPTEQTNGNAKRIGPWTDYYALGATIYNLLSNIAPPDVDDVMYEGHNAFHFPANVSTNMQDLVIWLMNPDMRKRPQNITQIKEHLCKFGTNRTTSSSDTNYNTQEIIHNSPKETIVSTSETKVNLHSNQESKKSHKSIYLLAIFAFVLVLTFIFVIASNYSKAEFVDEMPYPEAVAEEVVEEVGLTAEDSAAVMAEFEEWFGDLEGVERDSILEILFADYLFTKYEEPVEEPVEEAVEEAAAE